MTKTRATARCASSPRRPAIEVERCDLLGEYFPEPVRSPARAYMYVGLGARNVATPKLDPTEHLEVELASVDSFRTMLRDGTIDGGASIAAGYRALDYLGEALVKPGLTRRGR